jgi:hypothetical protein
MAGTDGYSDERTDALGTHSGFGGADRAHGVDMGKAMLGAISGDGRGVGCAGPGGRAEITSEMIAAGLPYLIGFNQEADSEDRVLADLFSAMFVLMPRHQSVI